MGSTLFALDIGTRSVVGIILEVQDNHFHVTDILIKEHKERVMVDGQIHNVVHVADLIKEIKLELEFKHGPLTKVNVAAAGRSLITEQASLTIQINNRPILTEEDISRLELQAVQLAQQQLLQNDEVQKASHYYCVGYSVLFYKLDGEEIGSLIDQQGEEVTIEVIATFLPRVVVESLLAALKRADLEMEAMTLEPIAAINVLIPSSMRRLNVALVDIGAGTSDIAITDKGTIIAYGMVPIAGDEITEALSEHYLLDFPIAESTKRLLQTEESIPIQDILGFEQVYTREEVINTLTPSIKHLAKSIGREILNLNNQQAPKAVMLVGGGSLTPNLTKELASILQLPVNRVAVRGIDAIQNLTKNELIPVTPELVTPIGIAIAAKKAPIQYMSVTVNDQVIRLFEMKEMTVADAFLVANITAKQLYGKPGKGISIHVNGGKIDIPGGHGEATTIYVNGQLASAKSNIQHGDVITLSEGKDGQDATATLKDIIDSASIKSLKIQDTVYEIEPEVKVNGKMVSLETFLHNDDQVLVKTSETIEEILKQLNRIDLLNKTSPFYITVNNQRMFLPEHTSKIWINEKPGKLQYSLRNGDHLLIEEVPCPNVQSILNRLSLVLEDKMIVTFQGEEIELVKTCNEVFINGTIGQAQSVVQNGDQLVINQIEEKGWRYQDIFRFTNWQLPSNFKGQFTVLRNGEPSSLHEDIFGGDILEIQLTETNLKGCP
ncbi:cell division protein FtsA [Lysinibacillus composti]|uniref:Cell division protein n=1 Tax=Lysinibacillus composti TaxID=720633 RepID=A0A3N9UL92_9BACI|nr:pilus assembly protein PilM [Lysinibacillus composti]MBM7606812.1 cell division protein FtsA [Lysinibacillus composti]RQW76575.1 cell division protein [Lysinibacillus composti]